MDQHDSPFVAHVRDSDKQTQTLAEHLESTGRLASSFAAKAGLPACGTVMGMLHDFGKYADVFQKYLASSSGLLDQDHDDFMPDAKARKGKIDHSTSGAQYVFSLLKDLRGNGRLYGRMLAMPMASHHSGLMDSLDPQGKDMFQSRIRKDDSMTHEQESLAAMQRDAPLLMADIATMRAALVEELDAWSSRLPAENRLNQRAFAHGLLVRFLLSCLLDADRIDSACFETPSLREVHINPPKPDWTKLAAKLQNELADKDSSPPVNSLRREIADHCLARANDKPGLFTLTVPTGGGKTLSSLRFALNHACEHGLDHIFYIIPYTSIIDQNADVARNILEAGEEQGTIVLEHHSNIMPDKEHWRDKLIAQNWDAPVVFTTLVQFLETLFGSGNGKARRMHNLARSVLIFDEIQTLPPRLTYMFCNALNFLVDTCGSSVMLCTATQPLLGQPPEPEKGMLNLGPEREIMPNTTKLFADLRRVEFIDHCTTQTQAMDCDAIGALALQELEQSGSCLVVANTKKWARNVFAYCRERHQENVFYLSTALCPAHRMALLSSITKLLEEKKPVLCVSTQLIECGVDVSFQSAIRFAAGLDSILQTAGRCNRNNESKTGPGRVHIVRPPKDVEDSKHLEDIKNGKDASLRILREFKNAEGKEQDISDPSWIERYFQYYFNKQKNVMEYTVGKKDGGRDDTLLNILGANNKNIGNGPPSMLRQSFKTASEIFKALDSTGKGVIVPYGEGEDIIAELCSASGRYDVTKLLRKAQRYSVNVFSHEMDILKKAHAIILPIPEKDWIRCLNKPWYDDEFGLTLEAKGGFGADII